MTTLYFLILNSFLLVKLLINVFYKLFLISDLVLKSFSLLLLVFILVSLLKYPPKRFKVLSKQRSYKLNKLMKYALKTKLQHLWNIFIIISFAVVCSFILFFLRYNNRNKVLDLKKEYQILLDFIETNTIVDCLLNFSLLFFVILIYFVLIIKITRYFKFHIIKRHLYLIKGPFELSDNDNWYERKFFHGVLYKVYLSVFNVSEFLEFLYNKLYFQFKNKKYTGLFNIEVRSTMTKLEYEERLIFLRKAPMDPSVVFVEYPYVRKVFWHLVTKGHYVLLCAFLIYDLIFNNFQIAYIFQILPWIFFYDIYVRVSKFIDGLDLSYDECIHKMLYFKTMEIWDSKTLFIDGEFYDYDNFKKIYHTYMLNDFVKKDKD